MLLSVGISASTESRSLDDYNFTAPITVKDQGGCSVEAERLAVAVTDTGDADFELLPVS